MKNFYVFVEGNVDKIFFDKIFSIYLTNYNVTIIEYSTQKPKKTNNYLKAIKYSNDDYIFIADQDGCVDKKDKVLSKYSNLDNDKLFISIFEIESWIIAGLSDYVKNRFKIKFNCTDTSIITKEKFNSLVPTRVEKNIFISYILNDYCIESAISCNNSFKILYDYLTQKKAS